MRSELELHDIERDTRIQEQGSDTHSSENGNKHERMSIAESTPNPVSSVSNLVLTAENQDYVKDIEPSLKNSQPSINIDMNPEARRGRTSQDADTDDGLGEELVTVPVAKLQQLVKYGIQVLQESRRIKKSRQKLDLEHSAPRPERDYPEHSVLDMGTACLENDSAVQHTIDKIWDRAKSHPWRIKEIAPSHRIEIFTRLKQFDQQSRSINVFEIFNIFDDYNALFKIAWEHSFCKPFQGEESNQARFFSLRRQIFIYLMEDDASIDLLGVMICFSQQLESRPTENPSIGSLLERCYKAEVFTQPPFSEDIDTVSCSNFRHGYAPQISLIARAIAIFNDRLILPKLQLKDIPEVWNRPLGEILALEPHELLVAMHIYQFKNILHSSADGISQDNERLVRIDDLDIESLQTIGKLTISWTNIVEQHLSLDLRGDHKILYIAWLRKENDCPFEHFQNNCVATMPESLNTRGGSGERAPNHSTSLPFTFNNDIAQTWAMLFSKSFRRVSSKIDQMSHEKDIMDNPVRALWHLIKMLFIVYGKNDIINLASIRKTYGRIGQLPNPLPVKSLLGFPWSPNRPGRSFISLENMRLLLEYHMPLGSVDHGSGWEAAHGAYTTDQEEDRMRIARAARTKTAIPYSEFGTFEVRVRQLRHYMDSQKPRGFRELWRDNRDSLNYYTFWGVIIFGVLSVFLALSSLAVSIAQTYASFKALG